MASMAFLTSLTTVSCGGSGQNENGLPDDEGLEISDSAARADARMVIEAPENSSARERALIDIRAKESRLRASGYDKAADQYHNTVSSILIDSLGLVSPHQR